jgi:uracil-DNA glycosylase
VSLEGERSVKECLSRKKGTSMISIVKGKTEVSHNPQIVLSPFFAPSPVATNWERKKKTAHRMGSSNKLVGGVVFFWSR